MPRCPDAQMNAFPYVLPLTFLPVGSIKELFWVKSLRREKENFENFKSRKYFKARVSLKYVFAVQKLSSLLKLMRVDLTDPYHFNNDNTLRPSQTQTHACARTHVCARTRARFFTRVSSA